MFAKNKSRFVPHNLAIPAIIWSNPWCFLAFGCGIGAIPLAPGTFASLAAVPIYLLLAKLGLYYYSLALIVISIAAIILSDYVARLIQVHDHPGMCVDEIVGYLVTMLSAPSAHIWLLIGFVLFRLFDIWKPQPIRFIDEKIPGGLGVVLDDIVAGIFSLVCMQIIFFCSKLL
jgi:phosphatidylglycerophosphatase A